MMGLIYDILETLAQKLMLQGYTAKEAEEIISKSLSSAQIHSIVEKVASQIHLVIGGFQ